MTKQARQSVSSWGAVSESMSRFSQIREAKQRYKDVKGEQQIIQQCKCEEMSEDVQEHTSLLDNAETMKYFIFRNAFIDGNVYTFNIGSMG